MFWQPDYTTSSSFSLNSIPSNANLSLERGLVFNFSFADRVSELEVHQTGIWSDAIDSKIRVCDNLLRVGQVCASTRNSFGCSNVPQDGKRQTHLDNGCS